MSGYLKAVLKILGAGLAGSVYAGVDEFSLYGVLLCVVSCVFGALWVYFEDKQHPTRLIEKLCIAAFGVGALALIICSAYMPVLKPFAQAFGGSFSGIIVVETVMSMFVRKATPRLEEGLVALEAAIPMRSFCNQYKLYLLCFGGAAVHFMLAWYVVANANVDGGVLLFSGTLLAFVGLGGLVWEFLRGTR